MSGALPPGMCQEQSPSQAVRSDLPLGSTLSNGWSNALSGKSNSDSPSSGVADPESIARTLSRPGNVVFRDTPLAEVILILSEQWNINIVAGSNISGQVSGTFKNESLQSILNSILRANGMLYQQIGNSLVVLPSSENTSTQTSFEVAVLDVSVQTGEEMDELIAALKLQMSPDGQLVPIRASNKLTVLDTPQRIEAVRSLLRQLIPQAADDPNYVSTFPSAPSGADAPDGLSPPGMANAFTTTAPLGALELRPQYIMASDLQESLTTLVGEGNITLVSQENAIVVFGDSATQRRAELLMQQLDRPRAQVRITGYIYDVDLGEIEKLGVDWGQRIMSSGIDANGIPNRMSLNGTGLLTPSAVSNTSGILTGVVDQSASAASTAAGTAGAAATATAPVGGQFLFRTLSSSQELQLLIQALEQTKGSRLLADPHVTVVDRHLATLGIVTEIPVQQLTQTQQGGAIGSTSFKEAGIKLEVLPRIASDGTIEMEVRPEFSVLAGYQNGNPIIDARKASTVVRVNHGQALVIGGLRSKTTVETVKGIPGLMNVKYLGALFRTHDTDVRESELLVFIMPEIVGYCGGGLPREMDALGVTQRQLSQIQTAVDGPFVPDCRDPHCPQHAPRPRIHSGAHDVGLIGRSDLIFVDPRWPGSTDVWLDSDGVVEEVPAGPATTFGPAAGTRPSPPPSSPVEAGSSSATGPASLPNQRPAHGEPKPRRSPASADSDSLSRAPSATRSSRRTPAKAASYRR